MEYTHDESCDLLLTVGTSNSRGARGSVVGWGTILQAGKVAGSSPDEAIGFFNWPNPSSRTMALGSIQPLTEMSIRNLPEGYRVAGA
jgi:hypothetical protein